MDLKNELNEKKVLIKNFLKGFFVSKRSDWKDINRWGVDSLDRLEQFTYGGKMLRGALVLWTAKMLGVPEEKALPAAAAMELLQTALLMHDDIIDKDELRRGLRTVHKQYEVVGGEESVSDPAHFGVGMGICVGDLAFFLAYEVLAECDNASLMQLFSELTSVVGLGQMQDVYFGESDVVPSDQDVLAMYEHKTATYTFCLPFLLAARLAGSDSVMFNDLGKLLGKLFQIKDDELGLFGSDAVGKSVGLDIVQKKKTLYYVFLLSLMSDDEKVALSGEKSLDGAVSLARLLLKKYAVHDLVQKEVAVLLAATESVIDALFVAKEWKSFLHAIVAFNQTRIK